MPKPTSAVDSTPVRVVIITLDSHLASGAERAGRLLRRELPGLSLNLHAASEWSDEGALARCHADIAAADVIVATMLFMEDHIQAVLPALEARRDHCDVLVGCMSAPEVVHLTRLGRFTMDGDQGGPLAMLKKLRGGRAGKGGGSAASAGARQMAMLRRLPKILRYIPGTAQDLRVYFLSLAYWLAGSEENIANLVRMLLDRYADGERRGMRGRLAVAPPAEYPEVGLYHPRSVQRITTRIDDVPVPAGVRGTVGILLMRSYVLAGNTAHYDSVIAALEAKGYKVLAAFASGLDARPAVETFFLGQDGEQPRIDALVSLTGFSLVGGPAYNDAGAAEAMLAALDVPCLSAQAIEFQTIEQWRDGQHGLTPVEATMMVAIPELDGSVAPMVFGGRSAQAAEGAARDMQPLPARAELLAARVERMVTLRQRPRRERHLAIVLFDFPPNSGAAGTAAYLSVFASLYNTLRRLAEDGYDVEVPESVDALRRRILGGNAERFGTDGNVHALISGEDHVRREVHLADIEQAWGAAPGRQLTDGKHLFVLGERFGNVFVGLQPAFGYEGDPMRLLFEQGMAPTHAFSAFYRWLREDFAADAVLHFGTHGALEFMPGKQVGLSEACWPERLLGDLPNYYLYAANNPSEGMIARRRSAATLVSYLTPPVTEAGLYRGLVDLKETLDRYRGLAPEASERDRLAELIQAQAATLELACAGPAWNDAETEIGLLTQRVDELEHALIPHGLHVIGQVPGATDRVDLLLAIAEASHDARPDRALVEALVAGASPAELARLAGEDVPASLLEALVKAEAQLTGTHELDGLVHALDGGYVRPAPAGDLLRTPDLLPTGRNIHGFDPFRLPSSFALADGRRQAQRLLDTYQADGHPLPESVAMVLWGTDNLKNEGVPVAQALSLMGARPRFDGYGRLAGAELIDLEELGRPRIDVVVTLSGICRDLLPLQTRMLAQAAWLASTADEPEEMNFVRKHTLAYKQAEGCDLATAALRVFSNAGGAYGSNVNQLVDDGCWGDEEELAENYTRRKCYAYGVDGQPVRRAEHLGHVLGDVELTYQNLESVELGVTTIDHYFDTLGGISRAVERARGGGVPVYIGDQTRGAGTVRTLADQVALETRTRMLNPKWYEGMLDHGHEGVRQIEAHITNTLGWSATTGQVAPWVYEKLTETFVLDDAMRERIAALNPTASARLANRLLEAHERSYWEPDASMLDALQRAGDELEDRLEGIGEGVAA